ncbi:hypothetical protein KM043_006622 [Ampulex compressa]|nr:hypothetical protein KM043_006622 [Ampulex compressa]
MDFLHRAGESRPRVDTPRLRAPECRETRFDDEPPPGKRAGIRRETREFHPARLFPNLALITQRGGEEEKEREKKRVVSLDQKQGENNSGDSRLVRGLEKRMGAY